MYFYTIIIIISISFSFTFNFAFNPRDFYTRLYKKIISILYYFYYVIFYNSKHITPDEVQHFHN